MVFQTLVVAVPLSVPRKAVIDQFRDKEHLQQLDRRSVLLRRLAFRYKIRLSELLSECAVICARSDTPNHSRLMLVIPHHNSHHRDRMMAFPQYAGLSPSLLQLFSLVDC